MYDIENSSTPLYLLTSARFFFYFNDLEKFDEIIDSNENIILNKIEPGEFINEDPIVKSENENEVDKNNSEFSHKFPLYEAIALLEKNQKHPIAEPCAGRQRYDQEVQTNCAVHTTTDL